jgi:PAS domain S-box-containing protein
MEVPLAHQPIRALLVEDVPGDARLVEEMLRGADGYELRCAATLAEALAALRAHRPDIVLLDLGLPDSAGVATVSAVVGADPDMPVVAITGLDDERAALEAVQAGAQDYLTKGSITPDLVRRVIRYAVERCRARRALDASELKWRNVLVNTPQIGISLDTMGRITFANAYFLALTGWSSDDIIGRDWFATCLPDDIRSEVRRRFGELIATTTTQACSTYHNAILTKSGERREIAWANVVSVDGCGKVADVTSLGVDLTDRLRAEAEAERQLEELRRWQAVTIGREERIVELRREVNALAVRLGLPAPYAEHEPASAAATAS